MHPETALTPPFQAPKQSLSPLKRREKMVVSNDGDYGSDPGLQIPETPDIRSSMAQAALFSLDRSRRAQVEVCSLPITSQVHAYCVVAQASGSRGAKKMARDLQESVVLSGKRTCGTATVTFVAAPASKQQRDSRLIVLPKSRFNDTWWQRHLPTLTPAAPGARQTAK